MLGFLAPLVKPVLGAVASGVIGSVFDRKKQRDSVEYLEGKGLTPQEIAGSGAAGQATTGVGQVLGNQLNQLQSQKIEQDFAERERDKDRAVAIRAQDTSAQASVASAGISAAPAMGMLPYNQNYSEVQARLAAIQGLVAGDRNVREQLSSARNVLERFLAAPVGSGERATYANQLKAIALENAGNAVGNVLSRFNPFTGLGRGPSGRSGPGSAGGSSGASVNRRGMTTSQRIESKNYGHVID